MAKEKFGIAVAAEIAREVDELVAECDDLGAGLRDRRGHPHGVRSVRGEPRRTSARNHYSETKGHSLIDFKLCALSARSSKPVTC